MQQDRTDKHAELVEVVRDTLLHNRGGRELEASVGGNRNDVVGPVVDYKQTLRRCEELGPQGKHKSS